MRGIKRFLDVNLNTKLPVQKVPLNGAGLTLTPHESQTSSCYPAFATHARPAAPTSEEEKGAQSPWAIISVAFQLNVLANPPGCTAAPAAIQTPIH